MSSSSDSRFFVYDSELSFWEFGFQAKKTHPTCDDFELTALARPCIPSRRPYPEHPRKSKSPEARMPHMLSNTPEITLKPEPARPHPTFNSTAPKPQIKRLIEKDKSIGAS